VVLVDMPYCCGGSLVIRCLPPACMISQDMLGVLARLDTASPTALAEALAEAARRAAEDTTRVAPWQIMRSTGDSEAAFKGKGAHL
jgi:hypothetical protein